MAISEQLLHSYLAVHWAKIQNTQPHFAKIHYSAIRLFLLSAGKFFFFFLSLSFGRFWQQATPILRQPILILAPRFMANIIIFPIIRNPIASLNYCLLPAFYFFYFSLMPKFSIHLYSIRHFIYFILFKCIFSTQHLIFSLPSPLKFLFQGLAPIF